MVFYLILCSKKQTKHKLFAETCGFKSYKHLKFYCSTFFDIFLLAQNFLLLPCVVCSEKSNGFEVKGTRKVA